MRIFVMIVAIFAGWANAQAQQLPQVGKRVYIIEKNSPQPVAITTDIKKADEGTQVLRDPTLETAPKVRKPVPVPKPVAKVAKPTAKRGQLNFKPAKINGNLKNPRVEFQREYLKVGISEESYGSDFFQKIAEPLSDTNF
jgi:hypothetical protein